MAFVFCFSIPRSLLIWDMSKVIQFAIFLGWGVGRRVKSLCCFSEILRGTILRRCATTRLKSWQEIAFLNVYTLWKKQTFSSCPRIPSAIHQYEKTDIQLLGTVSKAKSFKAILTFFSFRDIVALFCSYSKNLLLKNAYFNYRTEFESIFRYSHTEFFNPTCFWIAYSSL